MTKEGHPRTDCVCQIDDPINPTERSTLYNAECYSVLRKLESGIAHAIIADPPYASGGTSEVARTTMGAQQKYVHGGGRVFSSFDGDQRDTLSWIEWVSVWLTECYRVASEGAYCMVFCDWRRITSAQNALQLAGFIHRGLISWNKGRSARAPHKGFFRHQCEYIVWGSKGSLPKLTHAGPFDGSIHVPVRRSDKHHLTGKPTDLMRQLVQPVPPGGLVIDPFMGSGTTGVACELEDRRFIGIEMDTHYFGVAEERIRDASTR